MAFHLNQPGDAASCSAPFGSSDQASSIHLSGKQSTGSFSGPLHTFAVFTSAVSMQSEGTDATGSGEYLKADRTTLQLMRSGLIAADVLKP